MGAAARCNSQPLYSNPAGPACEPAHLDFRGPIVDDGRLRAVPFGGPRADAPRLMGVVMRDGRCTVRLATALLAFASALSARAVQPESGENRSDLPKVAVYDSDPDHLWNRLYAAFYIRVTPDGKSTGHDELDAPLWRRGKYLMTQPSAAQARAVLDEFIQTGGEKQVADKLKRALLQRDLWAVFDYLASTDPSTEKWRTEQNLAGEQRQLLDRLAKAIRRLSLSPAEIRQLPDNYALAITAEEFPGRHVSTQAQRAFLPPDLLKVDGSWLSYGDPNSDSSKTAAPTHVGAYSGRAIFLVLLRLPEGRRATEAFLQEYPSRSLYIDLPAGTQVALVKQALLIDDQGEIQPTSITESVQIRAHQFPHLVPDAYEFHLARKALFEEGAGGLRPISDGEMHFSAFRAHRTQRPLDPFEHPYPSEASMPLPLPRPPSENHNLIKSCLGCHQANRREGFGSFRTNGPGYDRDSLIQATIRWKVQHLTWKRWRRLAMGDE